MTKATIDVQLPADRTGLGRLRLLDSSDAAVFGPIPAYGKADNAAARAHGNPTRDPLKPWGDTPLGVYRCTLATVAVTPTIERKYGPFGYIVLDPLSGPALVARQNGRFGLLIHAGALNAQGKLRPTFGCVRIADGDMKNLRAAIAELNNGDGLDLQCAIRAAA